ncbi:hypothetical protein ACFLR4_04395 [Bacteroidota bacterium]
MGFSTLVDIFGSTIIGSVLFLILLRTNDASVENTYQNGGELIIQQNLVDAVQLIEYDFRKIGYCADWTQVPDPSQAILSADSTSICFLSDVDSDSDIDTVKYFLGSLDELTVTPNPRDRLLYRVINGAEPRGSNLGITQFDILYFDALGNEIDLPVTVPGEIYTMQINVTVENTTGYNNEYTTAYWRQIRLAARNLKNR